MLYLIIVELTRESGMGSFFKYIEEAGGRVSQFSSATAERDKRALARFDANVHLLKTAIISGMKELLNYCDLKQIGFELPTTRVRELN